MTRYPPLFPRPGAAQRSLRTPPEPATTSPASGSSWSVCWSAAYSASVRYSCTSRVKRGDSMNLNTASLIYVRDVYRATRDLPLAAPVDVRRAERASRYPSWYLEGLEGDD